MTTRVPPILSTSGSTKEPAWQGRMELATPTERSNVHDFVDLWRRSRGREALVLRGSVSMVDWYRDLLFAIALRYRRDRPPTIMTDATWEPTSRKLVARFPWLEPVLPVIARRLVAAMDGPHLVYGVLSRGERETFSRTWGVPVDRVVFTPFPMTLWERADRPTSDEGYLFAGGNSLRDYDLLERAVAGTGVPVRVASTWTPATDAPEIEARPTSHEEFVDLLAGCRAMVLPMRESVRSAGQQTFLNAMVLRKPVVVTEGLGVEDYIENGVTGVVVPRDAEALRAAVLHVMDPVNADHYRAMGERARASVLAHFTERNYVESILAAVGLGPTAEGGTSSG